MYKFKIPYKCLFKIVQNPELLKAYCIYGKLKFICGKKGLFFNYKSNKTQLCTLLGISDNTLRKYIGVLKHYDLAWVSNNSLRLAHSYKIYESLLIDINYSMSKSRIKTKQIRLEYNDISPDFIIKEAIKLKKEQINFNNKNRIKELLIKEVGTIHCDKIRKKINRQANNKANRILKELKNNNSYNFIDGNLEYGFLDDNMSLTSLTKMIGRKSKSTSSNMLKRMETKNLLKKENRVEFIQPLDCFVNLQEISRNSNFPVIIKNKYGCKWLTYSLPSFITII